MSAALEIVARIGLTALVFLLITLLPWPDLPEFVTQSITTAVGYTFLYDGYLPVTYMFQLFFIELLLEGIFIAVKLVSRAVGFVGGGSKAPTE